MSELTQAFVNGELDKAEQILCERFPDAPPNTLAAVTVLLFLKGADFESIEPRLGELVEQIKKAWKDNGWNE